MSQLFDRLKDDLTASRRAQDRPLTLLLGMLVSDVKNREIELRRPATDEDVTDVLTRGAKRRRESIEMYAKGGRDDLAAKERNEVEVISHYLPERASDDEIRAAVREAITGGAANVGAVMGKVAPRFKGRADGSAVNAIVREELAARG
jgi:uncharacterized protein